MNSTAGLEQMEARAHRLRLGCIRIGCIFATPDGSCKAGQTSEQTIDALQNQKGCKKAEVKHLGGVIFNGVTLWPR